MRKNVQHWCWRLKYLQQKWNIGDESDCLVHQYHRPRKVAKNYEKFSSYDKAALKYFILRGKFHDIFSIDIDFKMCWTDFYIISRLWAKNSWFLKQKRHFRKRIQCILRKCISILWKTIRNPSEVYWSVWNQVLENIFLPWSAIKLLFCNRLWPSQINHRWPSELKHLNYLIFFVTTTRSNIYFLLQQLIGTKMSDLTRLTLMCQNGVVTNIW